MDRTIAPPAPEGGMLAELFEGWIAALTQPSIETFTALKEEATALKTAVGVGLLGLVIGLWALAVQPPYLVTESASAWVDLLRIIFFTEADFFIFSLVLFFVAKGFSGRGNFDEHSYLLSLVAVPLGMIIVALLFVGSQLGLTLVTVLNPLSSVGVVSILIILFAIYGLLLLLFALQAAHVMNATSVVYTVAVTAGGWGILRVAAMFMSNEQNTITTQWTFISGQWANGELQPMLWGHFWLVVVSVSVATVIGVILGMLITFPPRRPQLSHAVILVPFVLFVLLWAVSSGVLGQGMADQIADTVRGWNNALRGGGGFSGPLLALLGAIVRKPAAVGVLGAVVVALFYAAFLAGEAASELALYLAGIIMTIPSIALFGVLIAPLGIGAFNALFALVLYAQLPILRNTYTGIKEVAPEIVESGRGMGMTEYQLLRRIKLPMAVPVIMTGVRVSIVMLIGIASIAAYIGNDTLGELVFTGISRAQEKRYYAGAILIAILALLVDYFLDWLQARLTPEGLKGRAE